MTHTVIDAGAGVKTVVALQDGNLVTGTIQDCDPHVAYAKAMHNAGAHGSSEMRHAAHIPAVVVEKYCNLHGITFREFLGNREHVKRMCNDPDLRDLRIWPGRV